MKVQDFEIDTMEGNTGKPNFDTPFKAIMTLMKICGYWPYNCSTGSYQPPWIICSILTGLVNLLFLAALSSNLIRILGLDDINRDFRLSLAAVCALTGAVMVVTSFTNWHNLFQGRNVKNFVTSLDRVLKSFHNTSLAARKFRKRSRLAAAFGSTMILGFVGLFMTIGISKGSDVIANNTVNMAFMIYEITGKAAVETPYTDDEAIPLVLFITILLASYCVPCAFVLVTLSSLIYTFEDINSEVEKALAVHTNESGENGKLEPTNAGVTASLTVIWLRREFRRHLQAYDLVQSSNRIIGKPLLLTLTLYMVSMLIVSYFIIGGSYGEVPMLVMVFEGAFVSTTLVTYVCQLGSRLTEVAHSKDEILYNYLLTGNLSKDESREIKHFLHRPDTLNVAVQVEDLFVINRSALLTIASIIATYTVVVFQMA